MMILHDEAGNPVFHKHDCPAERKGQVMTQEELQAFAVNVLIEEYRLCGMKVERLQSDIDLSYARGNMTINVKVVYQQEFGKGPYEFDDSELIRRYREAGEIPHLMLASAFCDVIPTGMSAVCGANFCFKFYPVSLIPGEKNFMLPVEYDALGLAKIYAKAWNDLDASVIEPYLDKDFRYTSDAVFDEIPSRFEYIDYLEGKFKAISESKAFVKARPAKFTNTNDVGVLLHQDGNPDSEDCVLFIQTNHGRIISARMAAIESQN